MSFWTDSRADETRRRWLDGQSAQQIADALGCGCTRNAVIGKVQRMGLGGRRERSIPNGSLWRADEDETLRELRAGGKTAASIARTIGRSQDSIDYRLRHLGVKVSPAPAALPKPRRPHHAPKSAAARLSHAERLVTAAALSASIRCEEALAPTAGVSLVDLEPRMCRWVLGSPADLLYCGAARIGRGPYCEAHDKTSVSAESFRARRLEHA
jgi:GcrA cell cycle regulator